MFQKIVVAIDGSEMGEKALEAALVIGKEQKAEVNVLHIGKDVLVSSYAFVGSGYIAQQTYEDVSKAIEKEGQALLNKAKEKAESQGLATATHYITGDPARQIVTFAKENNTDLIVIGNRGLSGLKEVMLGSVSHKVSQLAECPVLIVK
ncbi:nucleotide-binding universal stress UspA family protein [Aneurinibacillus soli]|uniref:Universal stress protein n=1 Tax=Aneurinibacillus soli TaxID=1500254 RepID=A0A0U5BIK4_9BACL|nr:universal stress protein [Aneurinibacillus soli]PYE64049.1 nucleotide-binding universal stress UspA family protein [Aneurinibacillus soli]BAU27998.1 Stress response protein NhaX [Aneurinibacillus soli]